MVQTRFSKFFPRQEIVHKQGIIEPQRMIRYALITSGAHDQAVRTQLNYAFVTESQSWIVTQYRLELVDCYQGQDDLRVETLVCEANRFFCNRRFRFYEGDRLLAIVEAQYV
ncbi:MAG: acyl-ACP thioesterase domain-containing protein, partial [Abiotrophia defectiva]